VCVCVVEIVGVGGGVRVSVLDGEREFEALIEALSDSLAVLEGESEVVADVVPLLLALTLGDNVSLTEALTENDLECVLVRDGL